MIALRYRSLTAPRHLVVGLFVFAASCQVKKPPVTIASPAPSKGPPTETAPPVPTVMSGAGLVASMHERYRSTWYHSFTFVQKTSVALASGGDLIQTWYEAGELPGRLRIDTDIASKAGVLYARDSVYRFANGKLTQADTGVNDLLVLGFDVYTQPIATTEAALRRLGFDLAKLHETTWQGKAVYVVGAALGDTTAKQFWIEKERLLFVRMLQKNPRRGQVEVRFNRYVPAGKAWIAIEVEQLVNGKRTLLEEYSDVHTDVKLSPDLFDPTQWATVQHWSK